MDESWLIVLLRAIEATLWMPDQCDVVLFHSLNESKLGEDTWPIVKVLHQYVLELWSLRGQRVLFAKARPWNKTHAITERLNLTSLHVIVSALQGNAIRNCDIWLSKSVVEYLNRNAQESELKAY